MHKNPVFIVGYDEKRRGQVHKKIILFNYLYGFDKKMNT